MEKNYKSLDRYASFIKHTLLPDMEETAESEYREDDKMFEAIEYFENILYWLDSGGRSTMKNTPEEMVNYLETIAAPYLYENGRGYIETTNDILEGAYWIRQNYLGV